MRRSGKRVEGRSTKSAGKDDVLLREGARKETRTSKTDNRQLLIRETISERSAQLERVGRSVGEWPPCDTLEPGVWRKDENWVREAYRRSAMAMRRLIGNQRRGSLGGLLEPQQGVTMASRPAVFAIFSPIRRGEAGLRKWNPRVNLSKK